jgi:predicted 3-demethylubiquinone-9 3-methyltransferase (glyoxalase superfamily)
MSTGDTPVGMYITVSNRTAIVRRFGEGLESLTVDRWIGERPRRGDMTMSKRFQRITPFLWFDKQAEEAANFYVSVFPNSRIVATTRYAAASAKASGQKEGQVMTVDFLLDGESLTALNGGPVFHFNEAMSLVVHCKSQEEIDLYWDRLLDGAADKTGQCGWLKDRYGVSWQVVPDAMIELLTHGDPASVDRVHAALMGMQKLDLNELRRAAAG